jgi:hypothetical protein
MAKRIKKTAFIEVKDRPRGINYTFPGVDSSKVIHGYPVYLTEGVSFRMLWDNELTQFIKNLFLKLFRRR